MEIEKRLLEISEKEGIAVSGGALSVIAREAGGSMRDAQSLLDQVIGYSGATLGEEAVREVLGLTDRSLLFKMVAALAGRDASLAIYLLSDVYNQGYDIAQYYRELVDLMRNQLLIKAAPTISTPDLTAEERQELTEIGNALTLDELTLIFNVLFSAEFSIRTSTDPRIAMELLLIKMTRMGYVEPIAEAIERLSRLDMKAFDIPPSDTKALSFDFSQAPVGTQRAPTVQAEQGKEAVGEEKKDANSADSIKAFLSYLVGKDPITHSYLIHAVSIDIEEDVVVIKMPQKYTHLIGGQGKLDKIKSEFREYFKRELAVSLVGVEGGHYEGPEREEVPMVSEKKDPSGDLLESDTTRNIKKVFSDVTVEGYTPGKK